MSKILVIGGSRFIGKHILKKLGEKNHEILVLNRGNVPNENYLPDNATHTVIDRNNEGSFASAVEGQTFNIVYDISCITKQHAEIALNCLKGRVDRYVFISTGGVYDPDPQVLIQIPVEEDHPYPTITEDTHPYIRDKTQAELVLFAGYNKDKFPLTVIRPTFVYGPENYVYREAYFFDRISRDRPTLIPNGGHGIFDMVHVEDLADMTIILGEANSEDVEGRAYNGSSGFMLSGNMYANVVGQITGKNVDIVHFETKLLSELKWPRTKLLYPYIPEGVFGISSQKFERQFSYSPQFNYTTGFKSSYGWWVKNKGDEPDWELEDVLISLVKESNQESPDQNKITEFKSQITEILKKDQEGKENSSNE